MRRCAFTAWDQSLLSLRLSCRCSQLLLLLRQLLLLLNLLLQLRVLAKKNRVALGCKKTVAKDIIEIER